MKRVTILMDDSLVPGVRSGPIDQQGPGMVAFYGCPIVYVEDVPEPVVQEFLVRVEHPIDCRPPPLRARNVHNALTFIMTGTRTLTVTEVTE